MTSRRHGRTPARLLPVLACALALSLPIVPARAAPHAPLASAAELDRQSASVLEHLAAGDVERARVLARQLARRYPRFALGQLLHAELSAMAALDGTLVGSPDGWSPALVDLLLEARARLPGAASSTRGESPRPGAVPAPSHAPATASTEPPWPFVQLDPHVENLVLVDLERSRLRLHEVHRGIAIEVGEHYVSSGSAGFDKRREGDRKTPVGLYRITRYRSDAALPELYGAGALVLDYPNAWDRARGRTGSGIWLHGVPRTRSSRAPRSSEGCVTMSNEHFVTLASRLERPETLVFMSGTGEAPDASAVTRAARADARERYRALFRGWRARRVAVAGLGLEPRGGGSGEPLSAAELDALDALDESDITILESVVDERTGRADGVIMDLRLGPGRGLTLWWTRATSGTGWTLALEHRRVADA